MQNLWLEWLVDKFVTEETKIRCCGSCHGGCMNPAICFLHPFPEAGPDPASTSAQRQPQHAQRNTHIPYSGFGWLQKEHSEPVRRPQSAGGSLN